MLKKFSTNIYDKIENYICSVLLNYYTNIKTDKLKKQLILC